MDDPILVAVMEKLGVPTVNSAESAYIVARELVAMCDRGEIDSAACYRLKLEVFARLNG